MRLSVVTLALALVSGSSAIGVRPSVPRLTPEDKIDSNSTGDWKQEWFDQLIDHDMPELGTFKQRYFYSTAYYKGPGSPVSLEAPPEDAVYFSKADPSNSTMVGFIAQNIGGAVVAIEHRFYGESQPYGPDGAYNAETLQILNMRNSIQDLIYFAKHVNFPFDPEGKSRPDKAPWTLNSCSYAGALTAWTERLAPGTFWAYQAGSAVVESIESFWQYMVPVSLAMPKNCSADYKLIRSYMDDVLEKGSDAEKNTLKENLRVHANASLADVAEAGSSWMFRWQGHQYYSGYGLFYRMCDFIENQLPENSSVPIPGASGVGLEKALKGFFTGLKALHEESSAKKQDGIIPAPEGYAFNNGWEWQLCNEAFEWFVCERPKVPLGLMSRLYNVSTQTAACSTQFPPVGNYKVGLADGRSYKTANWETGGWSHHASKRLIWVNSDRDPWLYATVSSPERPGGPLQSTEHAPVYMLRGTGHCNDYMTKNYFYNEDARNMFDGVASHMKKWVAEFYEQHNLTRPE